MYASSTFISVVLITDSGLNVLFTIVMEALVEYIKCLYLGLDKKVREPSTPSSILANLETSTSGLPTTSPSKIPAICCAVNFTILLFFFLVYFNESSKNRKNY